MGAIASITSAGGRGLDGGQGRVSRRAALLDWSYLEGQSSAGGGLVGGGVDVRGSALEEDEPWTKRGWKKKASTAGPWVTWRVEGVGDAVRGEDPRIPRGLDIGGRGGSVWGDQGLSPTDPVSEEEEVPGRDRRTESSRTRDW